MNEKINMDEKEMAEFDWFPVIFVIFIFIVGLVFAMYGIRRTSLPLNNALAFTIGEASFLSWLLVMIIVGYSWWQLRKNTNQSFVNQINGLFEVNLIALIWFLFFLSSGHFGWSAIALPFIVLTSLQITVLASTVNQTTPAVLMIFYFLWTMFNVFLGTGLTMVK